MILKFDEYLNESYLKGGRQPLYHYTRNFSEVIKTDMLKTSQTVDDAISISFTRSLYYKEHSSDYRIVLDADLLKTDGYKIVPYDEAGNLMSKAGAFKGKSDYSKVNPYFSGRYVRNNVGIEDEDGMGGLEWEYEERSFEDIKNLGKYILAFDLTKSALKSNIGIIKAFLEKYPHIEVTILDRQKLIDRRNVVDINEYFDAITSEINVRSNKIKIEDFIK